MQIDLDGNANRVDYQTITVPAGETVKHPFPAAFSAASVRIVSSTDTTATALFVYE